MPTSQVTVPWEAGLHLREAAILVRLAQQFQAAILLRHEEQEADARSVLSIQMLAAPMGTTLELVADGEDAEAAIQAFEAAFVPREPCVESDDGR